MKKARMKRKQRRKLIWMVAGLVVLLYLGLAVYFHNHFFPKTTLNGRKAGGYTAQKVMDEITEEIHSYQLKIATRDKHTEKISGQDISLEPQWGDEITELVHAQNMFAWPVKIFQKQTLKNTTLVDYDKDKLQTQIDALDCMDADNQTAPENASVSSYDKTEGFTVVGCVMGTTIDAEKMYQAVQEAVEGLKENLSLEKAGVYEDPTVLDDDENLVKAVKKMNGYAKTKITFTVGDSKEVLDASVFGDWFRLNKKLKPVLDQECVKAYVSDLAKKYNTCYSAKTLKTSYGKTVTIPESHYGWKIDTEKEIAQITSEIKVGKAVERELNYSMTANSHGKNDYGDSYVEVNLTAQHMFLYKDGKLVIDSDFVSGNVSKNNATPTGAYGVTYTEKNATLRGENYETPVTYWMPFAGNVGMHDAYWRSKFGGSIYKYAGSHGCINLPPEVAKVVFENVKKNYPVLVYELPGTESTDATDKGEAKKVVKLIDALGTITKDSKEAVQKARNAYEKLTANDKVYVTNYDKLKKAEEKLQKLQKNSKE